jgi:hypothetical protein
LGSRPISLMLARSGAFVVHARTKTLPTASIATTIAQRVNRLIANCIRLPALSVNCLCFVLFLSSFSFSITHCKPHHRFCRVVLCVVSSTPSCLRISPHLRRVSPQSSQRLNRSLADIASGSFISLQVRISGPSCLLPQLHRALSCPSSPPLDRCDSHRPASDR